MSTDIKNRKKKEEVVSSVKMVKINTSLVYG